MTAYEVPTYASSLRHAMLSNLRQKVWHVHDVGAHRFLDERHSVLKPKINEVASLDSPRRRRERHGVRKRNPNEIEDVTGVNNSKRKYGTALPQLSTGPVSLTGELPSLLSRSKRNTQDELETRASGENENDRRTRRMRSDSAMEPGIELGSFLEDSNGGPSLGRKILPKPKRRKKVSARRSTAISDFLTGI